MRLPDSLSNGGTLAQVVRGAVIVLAVMGAGLLAAWGFDLAHRIGKLNTSSGPTPEQQVLALQTDIGRLKTENARLLATIDKNAAAIKAASATADKLATATALQEQQASKIKALELENGKLKGEAAALAKVPASKKQSALAKKAAEPEKVDKQQAKEGAVPVVGHEKAVAAAKTQTEATKGAPKLVNHGLTLRRFESTQPEPKVLHYRLILSQPLSAPKLSGRLQLVVKGSKAGQDVELKYPSAQGASSSQFVVKLGTLQRCEGQLALPEGIIVKSIQARVLEKGQVRISRTATLKDAAHVRS